MEILILLAIGLVVGVVSGSLGIGGGVLMLPALVWLCGMKPIQAAGTTLGVLVVPVVLPAALDYYKHGHIDMRAAMWVAVAFAIGGYAGSQLRTNALLPEELLRFCLGLVMMYIAWQLIISSDVLAARAATGLTATLLAWLAYRMLHALGKRALSRPSLEAAIQRVDEERRGDPDYHI
jgi:uncharacterized membrane protein YfcA